MRARFTPFLQPPTERRRAKQPSRRPRRDCALQKRAPSSLGALLAVQALAQPIDALAELLRRHSCGHEVHVEQRAQVPSPLFNDPPFTQKPFIERCSWKRGQDRDLNIKQIIVDSEVEYLLKDVGRMPIQ